MTRPGFLFVRGLNVPVDVFVSGQATTESKANPVSDDQQPEKERYEYVEHGHRMGDRPTGVQPPSEPGGNEISSTAARLAVGAAPHP